MSLIITETVNTVTVTGTQTNLTIQDTLAVPAGGDLSGSYPNPTVVKINGTDPATYVTQNYNAMKVFRIVDEYFNGLGSTSSATTGGGTVTQSNVLSQSGDVIIDAGATSGAAATAYLNYQFPAGNSYTQLKIIRGKFSNVSIGTNDANGFFFFGCSTSTPPANPLSPAGFIGFTIGGVNSASNWTACFDTSATSATYVDTGVVAADTDQLVILINGTNARYYINDVLVYTKTFAFGENVSSLMVQGTFRNLSTNPAGNSFAINTLQFDHQF